MSPQMARSEAQRLLAGGISQHLVDTIDTLAQAGVMSTEQLENDVSHWTQLKYSRARILDTLPFARDELEAAFADHRLAFTERTRLYALGPVGIEIVREKWPDIKSVSGYLGFGLTRVMHDVCVSETVLRIAKYASERGWIPRWDGVNVAALYSVDGTRQLLEPDAALYLTHAEHPPRRLLIEFHNEDHRTRAERKVDKYRNVCLTNADRWQAAWDTDTFPPVLAVFAKRIVGEGYRDKLAALEAGPVRFYGKLFSGVLQDNLAEWMNFTIRQKETIWEDNDSTAGETIPPPTEP
ncbi:MAG: hypothetical protein GY803_09820 [Chloroflexi bacterium]|nr:hypothetical protein [Chloroflexota bacterium]